ncbi:fungistatic metabolite [Fusarium albosuccineum]|uniref:Fungistatic metabolite n=1 Tax=Fusarium albosuccineum TaxID=1237068 RepID=A0A8H4LIF1_9HYPO|nr:fungistatic metabolite [Fusarium albosuccineum]
MVNYSTKTLLGLLTLAALVDAYWRMSCSLIQTGRVDPIIAPGRVAAHVHKISGASNMGISATYDDLQASRCTSCEIQDDKSAYWTPQLFYQHGNGSFEMVPNDGTVVYYLGRGENRTKMEPFPPGFKMLSGDSTARSADTKTMTYNKTGYKGRPVAERISFACLDSSGPSKERSYMWKTDCDNGMRAQVHFQSCWNGGDYQPDQSHVAYMSQIDNGICPPTHPRQLPHLFLEVIYGVNNIQKSKGGRFVFAQGDTTGYGFHGDFLNGWNMNVLTSAIKNCINNDGIGGAVSKCPVLAASQTQYFSDNCPEMPSLINEPVRGMLDKLPGCNNVTSGPAKAPQGICDTQPSLNDLGDAGIGTMFDPSPGDKVGPWAYVGCAPEGNTRTLNKYAVSSDSMTIQYCTASCKAQGYPLAGMENGRECYCAGSLTSGASYMKASTCASLRKMVCRGNMTQYCGGPDSLTIWNDTSYTPPTALVVGQTKISNGMATYYGCYSEGANGRALSADSTADTVRMTNEMCVAFCQAGGYTFAGTEYSQECYCGNSITSNNITDITQCSMQCRGNIFSYCGAGNRLSVWKIAQPDKPTGPITALGGAAIYSGCYTDGGPGGRTLPSAVFTGSSVSLDTCFAFCKKLNYPLFGMEYGRECYCGYTPKTQATLAADGDCRMPCAGDATQKCGAGNRISIWNNTLYTPMASPESFGLQKKYLGCYTEGNGARALNKAKKTSTKMTIDMCAGFCSDKGFAYIGLENSHDCYCSNKGPSSGSIEAPEAHCKMPCRGDKTQKCGAASRLNVYRISPVKKISSAKSTSKPVVKVQDYLTSHSKVTTLSTRARTTSTSKVVNVKAKATTTSRPAVRLQAKKTSTSKVKATTTTTSAATHLKHRTTKARISPARTTSTSRAVNAKAKVTTTTTSEAVHLKHRPTSTRTTPKVKATSKSTSNLANVKAKATTTTTTARSVVRVQGKATSIHKPVNVKLQAIPTRKTSTTLVSKTTATSTPGAVRVQVTKKRSTTETSTHRHRSVQNGSKGGKTTTSSASKATPTSVIVKLKAKSSTSRTLHRSTTTRSSTSRAKRTATSSTSTSSQIVNVQAKASSTVKLRGKSTTKTSSTPEPTVVLLSKGGSSDDDSGRGHKGKGSGKGKDDDDSNEGITSTSKTTSATSIAPVSSKSKAEDSGRETETRGSGKGSRTEDSSGSKGKKTTTTAKTASASSVKKSDDSGKGGKTEDSKGTTTKKTTTASARATPSVTKTKDSGEDKKTESSSDSRGKKTSRSTSTSGPSTATSSVKAEDSKKGGKAEDSSGSNKKTTTTSKSSTKKTEGASDSRWRRTSTTSTSTSKSSSVPTTATPSVAKVKVSNKKGGKKHDSPESENKTTATSKSATKKAEDSSHKNTTKSTSTTSASLPRKSEDSKGHGKGESSESENKKTTTTSASASKKTEDSSASRGKKTTRSTSTKSTPAPKKTEDSGHRASRTSTTSTSTTTEAKETSHHRKPKGKKASFSTTSTKSSTAGVNAKVTSTFSA